MDITNPPTFNKFQMTEAVLFEINLFTYNSKYSVWSGTPFIHISNPHRAILVPSSHDIQELEHMVDSIIRERYYAFKIEKTELVNILFIKQVAK